jgi:predicted permease
MAEELRFHLDARIRDLVEHGASAEEARRLAQLEFGASPRYAQECREQHRLHWLDEFFSHLHYALRLFRKGPGFASAAVLSLALGIGANTLVFSVVNSLLLRPLPIKNPKQVVFVETRNGPGISFPSYVDFRNDNSTFSGFAGYRIAPMSLEATGNPSRIWGYLATGNYFDVLGVTPALGRLFHQDDDRQAGASPYAVLSYRCWQTRFGGDPGIAGKTIRLNGLNYWILGVAPRDFHGTELFYWPEVWVPMMMQPKIEPGNAWLDNPYTWDVWSVGRLKPGTTRAVAASDLNRVADDLARRYPNINQGLQMRISQPGLIGDVFRGPVKAFTGGVLVLACLVLLTACSNLAGLMLARVTDRQREMAIRLSIGAGSARIIRQVLTESLLLATIGGAAGLTLATVLSKLMTRWHAPLDFPVQFEVALDWRVFAYAAALSLITGALFGFGPAVRMSRTNANGVLKGGSGFAIFRGRPRFALRDALVSVEVAFCFVLVFGSLLSLRSLQRSLSMSIGLRPEGVTTAAFELGLAAYSEQNGKIFQERALESVRQLPGVRSAAFGNSLPLSIDQSTTAVQGAENSPTRGRDKKQATFYNVSPGFFGTLGIEMIGGRDFNTHDDERSPLVAVVNRSFARQIMHTDQPVGKAFRTGFGGPLVQVIGLVEDGKYVSLTEEPRPVIFRPMRQGYKSTTTLVVRSALPSVQVEKQIQAAIGALDPHLPLYGTGSLASMLGFALFPMHAAAIALSAFGLLALVLAMTGIHGLVAYAVARRTREIGIRVALGARSLAVIRVVLGRLAALLIAGVLTGLILALAAGKLLTVIIYQASPYDPELLILVPVFLFCVAAVSCWGPVAQALRADPITALRYE